MDSMGSTKLNEDQKDQNWIEIGVKKSQFGDQIYYTGLCSAGG
jgi:hypothetical protein